MQVVETSKVEQTFAICRIEMCDLRCIATWHCNSV